MKPHQLGLGGVLLITMHQPKSLYGSSVVVHQDG